MKTKVALVVLLVAALAVVFYQHQSQDKLRADADSLAQQISQLHTDNENLSKQLAAATETHPLSDKEKTELLKLRGQVDTLNKQLGQAAKLRAENKRLSSQLADAVAPSEGTPEEKFKHQRIQTANALKQVNLAMRIFANDNFNQYATNYAQMNNALGGVTNFDGNISIDSFEFVNSGLVNDTMPDMMIFREREPRVAPSGNWERAYGLADGSVQMVIGSQGDETIFKEFEKQHSPHPAGQ